MSDAPVRVCPSCGKEQVERLISTGGGIVFKGPGFYATDYRQQPVDEGGKASSAKASGGEASTSRNGAPSASEPASSGSSEGGSGS